MRLWLWVLPLALGLLADNIVEGNTINYVRDKEHDFETLIKSAKGNFDKNSINLGFVFMFCSQLICELVKRLETGKQPSVLQTSAKRYANLAKQDPGRGRQNR